MAIQQRLYNPTASQYASAAAHLDLRAEWSMVYRVNGVRYLTVVSGTSGHRYAVRADAGGCACPWYEVFGGICSHRLAVMLDAMQDELAEEQDVIVPFKDYAALLPGCAAGCGDIVESGTFCLPCEAKNVYRQEQARKRENVEAVRRANVLLFGSEV